MACLAPDLVSRKILKSRLCAFTDSETLSELPRVVPEQTEAFSSSAPVSPGSSTNVASARGIFPTSESKCNLPPDVLIEKDTLIKKMGKFYYNSTNLVAIIIWFENKKHWRTASRCEKLSEAKRLRMRPLPGGTCTKLPI